MQEATEQAKAPLPEVIALTELQREALGIQLSQITALDQQIKSLSQQQQQHILQRDALLESIALIAGITLDELRSQYIPNGKEFVLPQR